MSIVDKFANFRPAGPVAQRFLHDRVNVVRALLGPVGAGKSVSMIMDTLSNAGQMPVCIDGIIRFRIAIIGQTYGQIERNLYPTWKGWLPDDGGDWTEAEFKGGGGRHALHTIRFAVVRGGRRVPVHLEAIFAAIGDHNIEQFMRGFEPSAFWLYEMDQLQEEALNQALFRIGRYPAINMLPAGSRYRSYVVGDLNAPDIDSWIYRRFEEDRPAGHVLYKQPSGRSPTAENLPNLQPDYYDRQVAILSAMPNGRHLVRRMVDAQYGPSLDGEPVYPEYSDDMHLSPVPLRILPKLPLRLGFDQGLRWPACVIGQRAPSGQYRIYAEVVPGRMNARRFAAAVKARLSDLAPNHPIEIAYADPAGFSGADREDQELAWAETVAAELGIIILPAPSNEPGLRIQAVQDELVFVIEPHVPGLIIDRAGCPLLRKGFASHYRYRKDRQGNADPGQRSPEKNVYSNPHDALQYLLLGDKGRYGAIAGREANSPRSRAQQSSGVVLQSSWNPWG